MRSVYDMKEMHCFIPITYKTTLLQTYNLVIVPFLSFDEELDIPKLSTGVWIVQESIHPK